MRACGPVRWTAWWRCSPRHRPGVWRVGQAEETTLSDEIEPLILDMLEWIARSPRAYGDVMDAWRTSCPRLTVWEDACDRGLVRREGPMVVLTESGVGLLASKRGRQPFA